MSSEVIYWSLFYDSNNGALKISDIQNIHCRMDREVYNESLISPNS